jgi:hypothetical protein
LSISSPPSEGIKSPFITSVNVQASVDPDAVPLTIRRAFKVCGLVYRRCDPLLAECRS